MDVMIMMQTGINHPRQKTRDRAGELQRKTTPSGVRMARVLVRVVVIRSAWFAPDFDRNRMSTVIRPDQSDLQHVGMTGS